MKKILIILVFALFAITPGLSFGQTTKKKTTKTAKTTAPAKASVATSAEIAEGKALISKSDCMTCHTLDTKVIGPAYKNVAVKYPDNAESYDQLAGKIIKGGAGVWGQIPMSPHSSLSVSDAKKMVKYILSLH
jgi:cytochrome c